MRALLFALLCVSFAAEAQDYDFFEKNIRPVLAKQCYACHSEKSPVAQGGLVVDSRDGLLKGGKSGVPAIVPGKPDDSLLIKALQHATKDLKMPPGKPLPPEQVQAFAEWIRMGAPDPRQASAAWKGGHGAELASYNWPKEKQHWAYQPLKPLPVNGDLTAVINSAIAAKLRDKGIQPLPLAGKQALLRRVTFDLTGLPPTPEQMQAFLKDASPQAFDKVVDRLLDSPQYGEKWGRHWLDLVRYADTAGDASDFPVPEMYRYRNYVIRSIHQDKPFDLFLREQLSGDLMKHRDEEDRREKLVATSYLAISKRFGQTMGEFHLTIDDTIDNVGRSMLGLTTGCARCHDHKFDPIPTRDYYALYGLFESTRFALAGLEHHQYLENFAAYDSKESAKLDKMQERMRELHATVKKATAPPKDASAEDKLKFYEINAEYAKLRESFTGAQLIYGVAEGKGVNTKVMVKGEPGVRGPEVPRGFLQVLGGQTVPADHKGSGRELLADWITDAKNPLTARVLVNRVWLWHFGRGLVNSPNDFGVRGDRPAHPELLDTLAADFMAHGWSLKRLHKAILHSRAYQTAAGEHAASFAKDPKNELYWRFDRRRLAAEELRDTMLAVSGNLDPSMGGSHPFPPRGSYRFTQHNPFVADLAAYDTNRRSVYLIQQRFRRHPYLELFDGPDPNNATAVRPANATPLQSLYFMNNEFVQKQADTLAVRAGLTESATPARVRRLYEWIFQREPSAAELQDAVKFLGEYEASLASTTLEQRPRAALTGLVRAMFASNEFFYLD